MIIEGIKQKCLCIYIHKHIHSKLRRNTHDIIFFLSLTGHMVTADNCNFLLPLLIRVPFAFSKYISWVCPLPGRVTQVFIPEGSGPLVVLLAM
jgi:hypothetical protein